MKFPFGTFNPTSLQTTAAAPPFPCEHFVVLLLSFYSYFYILQIHPNKHLGNSMRVHLINYEIIPMKIFCPEKIQITSHVPFTLFSLTLRIVPTNDGHICDPWNATDEVLQLCWRHLVTIFLINLLAYLTGLLLTCSPFTLISSFLRSTM